MAPTVRGMLKCSSLPGVRGVAAFAAWLLLLVGCAIDLAAAGADTTPPVIAIVTPTTVDTFATNQSTVTIAGTASDNVALASVTYVLAGATTGSGAATVDGAGNWTFAPTLAAGATTVTMRATDTSGNFAEATITITVSVVPPTLTIVSPSRTATFVTNLSAVTVSGTVSDPVPMASLTYNLTGATTGTGATTPDGSGNWSIPLTLVTGDTTVAITATDSAGNASTASITITVTVRPIATITPNGTSTNASSILFTIVFSKPVTGFGAGQLAVSGGTAGTFTAVDASNYTLAVTPTADGTVQVSCADGAGVDSSSDPSLAASASVVSDTTPPTIHITTPTAAATFSTDQATFTIAGTAGDNLGLAGVTYALSGAATGTGAATVDGSGNWSFAPTLPDGVTTVTVTAIDAAGNGTAATLTITVDTPSTPTITPNAVATDANPIVFTIVFSKPVVGFDATKLTVTGGTAGTFTTVDTVTSTLEVTPAADGTVQVTIAAGAVADGAGEPCLGASASVTSDRTAPTVTLSSQVTTLGSRDVTTVTLISSEPLADLSTASFTTQRAQVTSVGSPGLTRALTVVVGEEGPAIITLAAGAVHDAAGNGNAVPASLIIDVNGPGRSKLAIGGHHCGSGNGLAALALMLLAGAIGMRSRRHAAR